MKRKRDNKVDRILRQIAQQESVGVQEVRREIELSIELARQSTDPKAQAFWRSVPCKGDFPTPEEAILYIAEIVKAKQGPIKKDGIIPS